MRIIIRYHLPFLQDDTLEKGTFQTGVKTEWVAPGIEPATNIQVALS